MTWLAWRQQRAHVLGILGFTVIACALLALARLGVLDPIGNFTHTVLLPLGLLGGPAVVGALAGASVFAPDVERGSHALTLTQSVSRNRWWATKVLVTGVPLALGALVTGLVATWTYEVEPGRGSPSLMSPFFQVQGVVPVGHTLVVFAAAALLGLLRGNALLAVVGSLLAYLPLAMASLLGLRRYYAPPLTGREYEVPPGAWYVTYLQHRGPEGPVAADPCASPDNPCTGEGLPGEWTVGYHPGSRFWPFQFVELGIFLALAAVLLAAGWWVAGRRLR
ncbi:MULTISPECIES: hypothetical protein [Actinosynnema]|uniref:hypothetical protein n=1 Tax=Actinosynnema TaxID=40566 RepID=UPI0020A31134|nr:hypothetical protein [Actinosynnema pretiosum]MCP2093404.1 ABC-2 family transporter protein [Actinosynnema pretiosum]